MSMAALQSHCSDVLEDVHGRCAFTFKVVEAELIFPFHIQPLFWFHLFEMITVEPASTFIGLKLDFNLKIVITLSRQ